MTACGLASPSVDSMPTSREALKGGAQSEPSPKIHALVDDLQSLPPRERLIALLHLVSERFVFDPWQADAHLTQRADALIAAPGLGGCGAYALVEVAMVRALGLPARLVLTADADWLTRYQADGLSVISGHAFIEVEEGEGRWLLLDPTFQVIYDHYRPGQPFYPGRQVFIARGLDFHDLAVHSLEDFHALYARAGARAPLPWQEPGVLPIFSLPIDPPTALTKAGQVFLNEGRLGEAEDRLSKAITQAPDTLAALQLRAQLFFQRRQYPEALADLDRAVALSPDEPSNYQWRAHTLGALGQTQAMCLDLKRACALGACEDQRWVEERRYGHQPGCPP